MLAANMSLLGDAPGWARAPHLATSEPDIVLGRRGKWRVQLTGARTPPSCPSRHAVHPSTQYLLGAR